MSEAWIRESERILNHIKKLREVKGKDRLDVVRALRFIIYALNRSVNGWLSWVNNPDAMTRFSLEELREMCDNLSEFAVSFIEYDIDVTKKGREKISVPKTTKREARARRAEAETDYVI